MTTHPVHPSDAPPERLVMSAPEDALAAVPVILGFEPRESLVVMTFGGRETFHARVDLPAVGDLDGLAAVVDQVVAPSTFHLVQGVVLVVYCADQDWAETAQLHARDGFDEAGIEVLATVCSDHSHWWASGWPGQQRRGSMGSVCDTTSHRFRAQSVLRGQVVHGSRQELADLLAPVSEAVASVRAVRRRARTVAADRVHDLVARGVSTGRLGDGELATLLLSVRRPAGRDAAWVDLTRSDAEAYVRFWTDAVQRAPADLVADAAAVLALAAWVAGHGALSWCAVDRCRAVQPRHSLAGLVAELLVTAVSPSEWDVLRSSLGADPS